MIKKVSGLLLMAVVLSGCAPFDGRDMGATPSQSQLKEQETWDKLSDPAWKTNPSRRPMPYPPYYEHPKD
jgi:hypothetical protein